MNNKLVVVDSFFTKKEFAIINANLDKIKFVPLSNPVGDKYGFGHQIENSQDNKWVFKKIKDEFFPKKKLKVVDSSFRLRHNTNKVLVHLDNFATYNFICYLKGKELLYNGTGFYNDKNQLDRYVGFVHNRAIFFKGDSTYHADLQALGESSPRYTLSIFYKE
jgi:hypothetical protein|tara:strand:+ start:1174 stop:1662 length:489 start_codon:yes stop_codon:yes gene_type:complete